tara:strand:- start:1418 stop:2092 length:675 start_codon:yes stop_codon:yes gene_type:complete
MSEEAGFHALINALIKAQSEIDHATRDAQSVHHKYATLENVISAVKPALNKHGIYVDQETQTCDNGVQVQTIFRGHGANLDTGWVEIPVAKNDAHAYGSAMTYARRYSLTMACCLGSVDDDGHGAKENPPPPVKKAAPKPIKKELEEQGLTDEKADDLFKRVSDEALEKVAVATDMKELETHWREAVLKLKNIRTEIADELWQGWIEKLTVFRNEMLDREKSNG